MNLNSGKLPKPTLELENLYWQKGYKRIVGIDEVGRGSWAGPMVAAGVILSDDFQIPENLADSKLLKPRQREFFAKIIKNQSKRFTICEVSVSEINKVGIAQATSILFRKIARELNPDFCLIDAFYIKHFSRKKQMAVKGGDRICASIAAASIIAKVYRDSLMRKLHFKYPVYGFGKNKGYGTKFHQEAIKKHGFTKIHRTSYDLAYLLQ